MQGHLAATRAALWPALAALVAAHDHAPMLDKPVRKAVLVHHPAGFEQANMIIDVPAEEGKQADVMREQMRAPPRGRPSTWRRSRIRGRLGPLPFLNPSSTLLPQSHGEGSPGARDTRQPRQDGFKRRKRPAIWRARRVGRSSHWPHLYGTRSGELVEGGDEGESHVLRSERRCAALLWAGWAQSMAHGEKGVRMDDSGDDSSPGIGAGSAWT